MGVAGFFDQWNIPYIQGIFQPYGGCAGIGLGTGCSVLTQLQAAQQAEGRSLRIAGSEYPSA